MLKQENRTFKLACAIQKNCFTEEKEGGRVGGEGREKRRGEDHHFLIH